MKKTIEDTRTLLDGLAIELQRGSFHPTGTSRRAVAWQGAGVIFTTRLSVKGGRSAGNPGGSYTVISPHAQAAGLLLERIDSAFRPLLGSHIKTDFFERIAEAVTEHCAFISSELDTEENLLRVILREARDILDEMERGDFPCVHIEGEA